MALPQQRGDWPGRASCAVIRSAAAARGAGPGRAGPGLRAEHAQPCRRLTHFLKVAAGLVPE